MRKVIYILSSSLAAALLLMLLSASVASAQYPPGIGSVSASAAPPAAPLGGSTSIICTVTGSGGQPTVGADCTFFIVSQPGSDASLGAPAVTKQTNANGIATTSLYVGTTPGPIVVSVDASGVLTQVTVNAGALGGLPVSGGAGAQSGGQFPLSLMVMGGALLAAGAFGVWNTRRLRI